MGIEIGDIVRVTDKPDWECKAGWVSGMKNYCGLEAVVEGKIGYDEFLLDIDEHSYIWSDDIVTKVEAPNEFDMKGFSELLRL